MLDKFWRNLSALIRFFVVNFLQTLTEKRPEILADFKEINVLNFISVLFFFSVLSGVSTFKYFT